ncbi:hypothetical protein T484DRAFT_1967472 [Baffinella frigidus]|nr:hypothetical protein T484DRAFT_1967472 [Cryptophyta sp. CCMP2293]
MASWGKAEYEAAIASGMKIGRGRKHLYNNLGVILYQEGEQERAEEMLREAVQLDPSWKEAAHNLVYVRTQGRGPERAM